MSGAKISTLRELLGCEMSSDLDRQIAEVMNQTIPAYLIATETPEQREKRLSDNRSLLADITHAGRDRSMLLPLHSSGLRVRIQLPPAKSQATNLELTRLATERLPACAH